MVASVLEVEKMPRAISHVLKLYLLDLCGGEKKMKHFRRHDRNWTDLIAWKRGGKDAANWRVMEGCRGERKDGKER